MKDIKQLISQLEVVDEIAREFQDQDFVRELDELRGKLQANTFYLVVAGLFKRGKSSIINTLIGKDIAPVAVTPVTAIITLFQYDENERCEIIYTDNRREIIPVSELYLYVTEDENPENNKNIAQVIVYCNSELLKTFSIADTPGIGSIFEHNSETAYDYIPKIDAALFILSADMPMSKTDADFLREINKTAPHVIYVLNKADLLGAEELDKISRFNTKAIAEITGQKENDITLIPISCKFAKNDYESSNFKELENEIDQLISNNKNDIILQTGQNRLGRIANELQQLLSIKTETLQLPIKQIEKKRQSLNHSVEVMQETRQEFDILLKGQLDAIIEQNINTAHSFLKELEMESKRDAASQLEKNAKVNEETLSGILDIYTEDILSRMGNLKEETEAKIIQDFNTLLDKYQNRSQSYLNEFSKMLKELFGVSFEVLADRFDLKVYSSFYFLKFIEGQSLEPKLPAWYRYFPQKMKRRKYKSILINNIEHLIEVNKGRMLPDIRYKVTESYRQFKSEEEKQAKLVYNRVNKLLEHAISQKNNSQKEIESELRTLNEKREALALVYSDCGFIELGIID